MKRILLAFCAIACFGQVPDGTALPGPVIALPTADQMLALPFGGLDLANHFAGFVAPPAVTQITIASATAANPMVLTLASPTPLSVVVGGTVTISGAMGTGCSGMNAAQTVSATGASTITISFDGTGCTYTASSGAIDTNLWWQLPAADGTTGECLSWSAPYVLDWAACSGGNFANRTLSNLTAPTAINASLLFDTDNTYNIGQAATSTTRIAPANIYVSTMLESPLVRVPYYSGGAIADYFDIVTTTSTLYFKDSSNTTVGFYSNPAGTPLWQFRGKLVPDATTTYDLGSSVDKWYNAYISNFIGDSIQITANAGFGSRCAYWNNSGLLSLAGSACASIPLPDGTPDFMNSSDNTKTVTFDLSAISTATNRNVAFPNASFTMAGINITQTFTQNQTLAAHLLFNANNTYDLGTTSARARNIYADTDIESPLFRIDYRSGGSTLDYFDLVATASTLYFKDSSNTTVGFYSNAVSPIWQFRGKVVPDASATYDLGASSAKWLNGYINNFIGASIQLTPNAGFGNRCAYWNNSGLLSLATADCGTGTVTSVGETFTGGLISVSGSPVTTSGTLALTVAGTSGGIVYFNSASSWASSGALTANAPVIGGGAGSAPSVGTRSGNTTAFVTTTGTQTSGDCVKIDASGNHVAANGFAAGCAATNLGNLTSTAINQSLIPNASVTYNLGASGTKWLNAYISNVITSSVQLTGAVTGRCLDTNGTGFITEMTSDCAVLGATQTLSGANTFSGSLTVTGNFYARSFAGSGISCSGVSDGWTGWDTSGQNLIMCAGGNRYKVNLTAY